MGKTSIEWTDLSWPIVNGCARKSPGCEHCYAERLTATRLSQTPKYRGLAVYGQNGPRWTRDSRLWMPHLTMPLKKRTPARIFVADMGDLFYEQVTDHEIDLVFGVMWACLYLGRGENSYPGHTFQVLTKRADRMREYMTASGVRERWARAAAQNVEDGDAIHDQVLYREDAHPRIHLGVSIESQEYVGRAVDLALTPAAARFVSYEPALDLVDLTSVPVGGGTFNALTGRGMRPSPLTGVPIEINGPALDWVIVGGESGPGARPFDIAWARAVVEQCKMAGVACFVKQVGSAPRYSVVGSSAPGMAWRTRDKKGGDMSEWPEDLRVRQFPEDC